MLVHKPWYRQKREYYTAGKNEAALQILIRKYLQDILSKNIKTQNDV